MGFNEILPVIREFTGTMVNPYDLDELLYRLTEHSTALIRAAGAGIMLAGGDGQLNFVAATEERIVEAEQEQARLRSGACFEAFSVNEVVVSNDLATEQRWPRYAAHVSALGLQAVVGVPMNAYGRTIGVMNIYRDHPEPWTDEDVGAAEILVSMGASYVVHANERLEHRTLTEQLQAAIGSRDVIGQAKGILMSRANVDADTAFELLRERSQSANRKLRELAQELVDSHGDGGDADD